MTTKVIKYKEFIIKLKKVTVCLSAGRDMRKMWNAGVLVEAEANGTSRDARWHFSKTGDISGGVRR